MRSSKEISKEMKHPQCWRAEDPTLIYENEIIIAIIESLNNNLVYIIIRIPKVFQFSCYWTRKRSRFKVKEESEEMVFPARCTLSSLGQCLINCKIKIKI